MSFSDSGANGSQEATIHEAVMLSKPLLPHIPNLLVIFTPCNYYYADSGANGSQEATIHIYLSHLPPVIVSFYQTAVLMVLRKSQYTRLWRYLNLYCHIYQIYLLHLPPVIVCLLSDSGANGSQEVTIHEAVMLSKPLLPHIPNLLVTLGEYGAIFIRLYKVCILSNVGFGIFYYKFLINFHPTPGSWSSSNQLTFV